MHAQLHPYKDDHSSKKPPSSPSVSGFVQPQNGTEMSGTMRHVSAGGQEHGPGQVQTCTTPEGRGLVCGCAIAALGPQEEPTPDQRPKDQGDVDEEDRSANSRDLRSRLRGAGPL